MLAVALFVFLATAALAAPSALAGSPATVTVRVLGPAPSYTALIPPTQVTTTTAPVVNDGEPTHSCSGTSAAGALQLATSGDWEGEVVRRRRSHRLLRGNDRGHDPTGRIFLLELLARQPGSD